MDWKNLLPGDPVPWLVDTDTPSVPYLALRNLLDCPPDNPDLVSAKHAAYQAGYSSKPNQGWWKFGFPVFYVTDILQIVA